MKNIDGNNSFKVWFKIKIRCFIIKIKNTYGTSLASLAGPISERVVKPVALQKTIKFMSLIYIRYK